jgi:hypothetical protein
MTERKFGSGQSGMCIVVIHLLYTVHVDNADIMTDMSTL